ncbi:hypothetical protein CAPTEDRAFT_120026, partial [Capitella teleta]
MLGGFMNLFGNVLTILAVLRFKQLRDTVTNQFIISLSASDLLCVPGILVLPISSHVEHTLLTGRLWGLLVQIPLMTSLWISGLTMVGITIDRLVAVSIPTRYRHIMNKRVALRMLAVVWTLVLGALLP